MKLLALLKINSSEIYKRYILNTSKFGIYKNNFFYKSEHFCVLIKTKLKNKYKTY